MQLSTRLQNLGLAALAAVAVSLSAYAVWSVGQAPESAMTAALPGGSPLGEDRAPISGPDTDATTATDPAPDATATAGTAPDGDTPGSTAPPATSVAGWASAWSGPDADLLVIGDGFSNLRSQWIHQWATELAAERPVQIHHWAEAEDVRFNEPDVLSEGSGPGLTIWNASRGDTTIGEAAEHTQAFLGAASQVDAVLVSLGRGSAGEDVAASLDHLVGELDADLPVLVLAGPPGLYNTGVSDGILAWAQAHQDRVALVDLRGTAPDQATAEEWAGAFQAALP